MTLEEALPLVRSLSSADKRRLINALARELLDESRSEGVAAKTASVAQSILRQLDPGDEDGWTRWLDSLLDAASERIAGKQREMQALGIVDDAGELATSALPADMQPGSTTSVITG